VTPSTTADPGPAEPRRLLVVTGTRADFGLWVPFLRAAEAHPALQPRLLVTAMHLDPAFGATVEEVRASGFEIAAEVPSLSSGDGPAEMAASTARAMAGIAAVLEAERPEWLLLLGDRGEQLAAALAAVHFPIGIAHLQGGDRTLGAVDDTLRDMITRAAHLHFPGTDAAARHLRHLGEASWRIHPVGSTGLDDLAALADAPAAPILERHDLPAEGGHLLLLQHPETRAARDAAADVAETLAATAATGLPRIVILPNADAGGRAMAARLAEEGVAVRASVPRREFAVLLRTAAALVGNSSAGIIEAPLLGVPAVNIGDRQAGRVRGDNVVEAAPERAAIARALERALDPAFRASLSRRSPYGDGHASERIAAILAATEIDDRLLRKAEEA
jgi:UDP-hydrolysing UDP-N-acetyl-D-glucosamine 2-epimerase